MFSNSVNISYKMVNVSDLRMIGVHEFSPNSSDVNIGEGFGVLLFTLLLI